MKELTPEIEQFYKDKNMAISKMLARNPFSLVKEQVASGAVQVYEEIKAGEVVKDISLAWRVWSRAAKFSKPPKPESRESKQFRAMSKSIVERMDELEEVMSKHEPLSVDGALLVMLLTVVFIMEGLMVWGFVYGF